MDMYKTLLPYLYQPQKLQFVRIADDLVINIAHVVHCQDRSIDFAGNRNTVIVDANTAQRLRQYIVQHRLVLMPMYSAVFHAAAGVLLNWSSVHAIRWCGRTLHKYFDEQTSTVRASQQQFDLLVETLSHRSEIEYADLRCALSNK